MKVILHIWIVLMISAIIACGGGGGGGDEGTQVPSPENGEGAIVRLGATILLESKTIGSDGGALTGPVGSPIEGVSVTIPPGALENNVTVSIGYNDGDVKPVRGAFGGTILTIDLEDTNQFYEPVEVTVPYPGEGTLPIAYHVDGNGKIHLMDAARIDPDTGTFTYLTFHASSFTTILEDVSGVDQSLIYSDGSQTVQSKTAKLKRTDSYEISGYPESIFSLIADSYDFAGSYDSKFRPKPDGFSIINSGSDIAPLGECTGFVGFSQWYFKHHKKSRGDLFWRFLVEIAEQRTGQDIIVTRAWTSINLVWSSYCRYFRWNKLLEDSETYLVIQNAIANTNAPVIIHVNDSVLIEKPLSWIGVTEFRGHSVMAYATNGGRVFLYDPNDPDLPKFMDLNEIADGWRFDYEGYNNFIFQGDGSLYLNEPYSLILKDAEANFNGSNQAKVTIASHSFGQKVTSPLITLSGKITSGDVLVEKLEAQVNGLLKVPADVSQSGNFEVLVPLVAGWNYIDIIPRGQIVDRGWVDLPSDQFSHFELEYVSTSSSYYVRIYNIDDIGRAFVNDELVVTASFMEDTGLVDITGYLKEGKNSIRFVCENGPLGGYTYGFELTQDSKKLWGKECGKVLEKGCNNEDQTEGTVYDETIDIFIF